MKRNRYLLSLLASVFLLYYALPRLSFTAEGAKGTFSMAWIALAFFVVAGNLTGLLHHPKKQRMKGAGNSARTGKKSRSFNG